jgi:CheY-like chemotaxis protein
VGKESVTLAVDAANLARNLFALVPIPMAVLDSNATIVLANAAFRSVFPTEKTIRDLPRHDVEINGDRYDFERMPLQNGLSLVLGREVTDERRLHDRLESLAESADLGRMVPLVARELRQPLGDLADHLGVLFGLDSPQSEAREAISGAGREVERVTRIVDVLIDLSGDASVVREAVDFGQAIRRAVDAEKPPLAIECEIPDGLPQILGVPGYLDHVLATILLNARERALEGSGKVDIRLSSTKGFLRLDVSVRRGEVPERGRRRSASPAGGNDDGVFGLSMVSEVVRRLGGRIEIVQDEAFHVALDFPALPRPEGMAARVRALHGESLVGKSIMVVDDEIVITSLIEEFLSHCGARVEMFNSSAEAYRRLAGDARYDAIVCDQRMPGVSGESLHRRVEVLDPDQACRFVFVTGSALDEEARRFFARTHTRYILKPFSLNDLYTAVSTAVDGRVAGHKA